MAAIPEDCHLCTEISKRQTIMQATVDENSTTQIMLALTHLPVFCLLIFPQLEVIPGLYHFPGRFARQLFRHQPPLAQRARWINDLE